MKIIVILMLGTIATLTESQPGSTEQFHLTALQKISDDLDKISVVKVSHQQKIKDVIARRFQDILQSDLEHHEKLKASLQQILDDSGDVISFGNAHMELINNISKKIEFSRANDKDILQILENETRTQVDAFNKKRSEQETELKSMVIKIFTTFSVPLRDCSQLMEFGLNLSGIYQIKPKGMDLSFPAYCDMDNDGSVWTVIQRRGDFNDEVVNFNRSWNEYKNGFGNLNGEFWLGNEKIHLLTKMSNITLRISVRPNNSDTLLETTYYSFKLEPEQQSYVFRVILLPNVGSDPFSTLRSELFMTYDHNPTCYNGAGWWYYNDCRATAHLNGPRGNVNIKHGVSFDGSNPVALSTMKIKLEK